MQTEQTLELEGEHVSLCPLSLDHEPDLAAAAADGELWTLNFTFVPSKEETREYIETALKERAAGKQYAFVVRRKADNKLVGCTRFYDIEPAHKNMAIGYTWYSASAQRTAVNTETKLLLLSYAFDQQDCISIAFHTDHLNVRSQAAIARLGAKKEGILRNHRILPNGRIRHTWCFSITNEEWPYIKDNLKARLKAG